MKKWIGEQLPILWRSLVWLRWRTYWWYRNRILKTFRRWAGGVKAKRAAETSFWRERYANLTAGCVSQQDKDQACLQRIWDEVFPRYQKFLFVQPDSFAGLKVVDVGCGPTSGLYGFQDCEKYAVDHLLDEYREIGYPLDQHNMIYRNARLEKTGLQTGEFDRVLCVNALDHVDHVRQCVREISRLLKPGGEFLAQIGFHDKPTPTEPHVMRHDQLLKWARKEGMRPLEIRMIDQSEYLGEYRYFYRMMKD
jgi:2-polyprenyl-3-methyl-5-hydroxy-6-metoxy-1,4-benzoquinol methylase